MCIAHTIHMPCGAYTVHVCHIHATYVLSVLCVLHGSAHMLHMYYMCIACILPCNTAHSKYGQSCGHYIEKNSDTQYSAVFFMFKNSKTPTMKPTRKALTLQQ